MINKTLIQLVSFRVRLPFVRPEVAANDELTLGCNGDRIIGRLNALIPPACKARIFIGEMYGFLFW